MIEKHKHPFAKYSCSIADKLIPKLSEEEIKEQEQEFERIESILTNRDISRLPSIIFNKTEQNNGTDKARQETY